MAPIDPTTPTTGGAASSTRSAVLHRLCEAIESRVHDRPTLVAIEGRSAAGTTTLANALAATLQQRGRAAVRCSIDDFHTPRHKYRSIHRQYTPATFFGSGYDYAAFRAQVIDPLLGGEARCRLAFWDSHEDIAATAQWQPIPARAIVVIDGAFLFHPCLHDAWDYAVWLDIGWETMIERATTRDVVWVGSADAVVRKYHEFWIPAHIHYEALCRPRERCNVVIDNTDVNAPVLLP